MQCSHADRCLCSSRQDAEQSKSCIGRVLQAHTEPCQACIGELHAWHSLP